MNLITCEDQKGGTVDEFYRELIKFDNHRLKETGKAMLDLIVRLRGLPDERQVFCITSHYNLYLFAEDTRESPKLVDIFALDNGNYFIEYRMTPDVAPWSNAFVKGAAMSEEDAIRMVLIGMEKSMGWSSGAKPGLPKPN